MVDCIRRRKWAEQPAFPSLLLNCGCEVTSCLRLILLWLPHHDMRRQCFSFAWNSQSRLQGSTCLPCSWVTNVYHHTQLLIGVHSPAVGSCVYKWLIPLISYFLPELEVAETWGEPVSGYRCLVLGSLGLASVLWFSSFSGEDVGRLKRQTQRLEQVSVKFNEDLPIKDHFWIRMLIDLAFKA